MSDEIIDSCDLFPAMELEVQAIRLPSGEIVYRFEDCTNNPPLIYKWAFDLAREWIEAKEKELKGAM
jgi:hypothetical protein